MRSGEIAYRIRRLVAEQASVAEMLEKFGFTAQELEDFLHERYWAELKEERPTENGKYLCVYQGKSADTGFFQAGHFRLYGENHDNLVTKWMRIPRWEEE